MRDNRAFLVWEEALRFVRERDLGGYAGTFAPEYAVELPLPLPGVPRRIEEHEEIRSVLAPVWRAQRASRPEGERSGEKTNGVVLREGRDPEVVVIEFDLHGVESSGMPYRLSYVHLVAVHDGRIATLRDSFAAGAGRQRLQSTRDGENKALVRRYFDMCSTGDLDGIDRVLASGYVDHAHPKITGPAAVADLARRFLAANPGATLTIDTLVADGQLVAARTTLRRTRGGKALVTSGMAFFRVSEDKLAEQWSCYPRDPRPDLRPTTATV
jgi:ketosteroid isomerase-like protein